MDQQRIGAIARELGLSALSLVTQLSTQALAVQGSSPPLFYGSLTLATVGVASLVVRCPAHCLHTLPSLASY